MGRPDTEEIPTMSRKANTHRSDVYTRVTNRIIEDLERGVRSWHKPWSAANAAGITRPLRHNGLPYSGINIARHSRSAAVSARARPAAWSSTPTASAGPRPMLMAKRSNARSPS
jgi:hypothetical protein